MKRLLLIALLPGCMSLPADPTKMSAEQLREWAKDKSAGVQCVIANTPWGRGIAASVNVDARVLGKGSVTVDSECKISLTNEPK